MLDKEETRDLILGKLKYRKCPCCDNQGMEYWDGQTGMGANPSPSGIDPEWLTWGFL